MSVYDYLRNDGLNDTSFDVLSVLEDQTAHLFSEGEHPISPNYVQLNAPLPYIKLTLNDGYSDDHYITLINTSFIDSGDPYVLVSGSSQQVFIDWSVPYENETDSYFFVITQRPFGDFQNDSELLETEFIVAYGVTFTPLSHEEGEPAEEGEPPELVSDPNATQSIRILDGTSLDEYSIVPDVYDVKISQTINGPYTLSFKLLPYINASNVYTPRIIECDGDYFHVLRITKQRNLDSLEMTIDAEHVSYELNEPPREFWDEVAQDYTWTEDTYRGRVYNILSEMLSYNDRFYIGRIDVSNTSSYTFTTSTTGFRSRILEFAAFIGCEVEFHKFRISFVKRLGSDNGLRLEVGKNIVGMTEIIDTLKVGRVKRSYEIEVLDLYHINDELERPLELHDINLGDTLTLIDSNYLINRSDRVVSIEYDPFKKSLPTIELSNGVATFTNSDTTNAPATVEAEKMTIDYMIETARHKFTGDGMYFIFSRPYYEVNSVTLSASTVEPEYVPTRMGEISTLNDVVIIEKDDIFYYELVRNGRWYTGVKVYSNGSLTSHRTEVSLQAICDPSHIEIIG